MQASPADQTLYDESGSTAAKPADCFGSSTNLFPTLPASGEGPRGLAGCDLTAPELERFQPLSVNNPTAEQKKFVQGFEEALNKIYSSQGGAVAKISSSQPLTNADSRNIASLRGCDGKMSASRLLPGSSIPLCVQNLSGDFVDDFRAQESSAATGFQSVTNSALAGISRGTFSGHSVPLAGGSSVQNFYTNHSAGNVIPRGSMYAPLSAARVSNTARVVPFGPSASALSPHNAFRSNTNAISQAAFNAVAPSQCIKNSAASYRPPDPLSSSQTQHQQQQQRFVFVQSSSSFSDDVTAPKRAKEEPQTVPCIDSATTSSSPAPVMTSAFPAPAAMTSSSPAPFMTSSFPASATAMTSSSPAPAVDAQERARCELKRARNRDAARKCREKKLELIARLESRIKQLTADNDAKARTAAGLRAEVGGLRRRIEEHARLGCHVRVVGI